MTGDTHPTQPLPDPSAQWVLSSGEPPRRPRRTLRWVVAGLVVVVLALVAWFAGEAIARGIVVNTIRQQIVTNLSLPEDHPIDVDVPGAVLPQLIGGSLDELRISSADVSFGPFTGDIAVEARDIPVSGERTIRDGRATVTLDQPQLQELLSSVDGFPAQSVGLAEPDITATIELSLFGAQIPVGLSLTPGAKDGELVLTPSSVQVAGSDIGADELRRQFGIVSNAVLRDWPVCIAAYLPQGLTLSEVAVTGDVLRARFDVADDILVDRTLLADGACS
ncbi:DUF2993 domain-containing protein [Microbacterium sp. zg.Y1090]|uniref:LmeA family phospholipid-binding protein n=1 Tax=Microbacterium TaxID=33882 RepID=UPI00214A93D8|nr:MULTISPECIES: DUF2993 domain-containing protein [unclassified Microbacterium]MCR2813493.1 DUF2993 domain-containing protein [Microbacterium sp. zg.Y1084]MCR2818171.1 DUF2993 domain-containing protein [Microbacterium sp. zg.Y1090]MDL5486692.1 DUF2993 domain-containing protein [Microbacterium sp. zg-Y1211]WIM27676.1 DUF2993 domain-containing protein [Microbacterium sp. zg-Y1090]